MSTDPFALAAPSTPAAPPIPLEIVRVCAACGSPGARAYCSDCGQRVHAGRFTIPSLLRVGWEEVVRVDRGFLHTVVELTLRPGRVVREYVAGRTRPFTNPVKYLLIAVAVAMFAFVWTGAFDVSLQAAGTRPEEISPRQEQAMGFFTRYFNLFLILLVPFMALFSRCFFRKARYSLAEHGIFAMYVFAQQNLFSIVSIPLLLWLRGGVALLAYSVPMTLYYFWACRQFFGVGNWSAALRGTLVVTLASLAYLVAVAVVVAGYARLTG